MGLVTFTTAQRVNGTQGLSRQGAIAAPCIASSLRLEERLIVAMRFPQVDGKKEKKKGTTPR
ncbi:hypothetical protein [Pseudogulbenkiania ferrooxidans]|uniref:hypothetical protein n=1 Tax=Pseudogulbenkiania ferrooxidans TaxID=549169 RepID=UPI00058BD578|nr:hypothetical protein [Pseudogulbenkiania ferrooxidans]